MITQKAGLGYECTDGFETKELDIAVLHEKKLIIESFLKDEIEAGSVKAWLVSHIPEIVQFVDDLHKTEEQRRDFAITERRNA